MNARSVFSSAESELLLTTLPLFRLLRGQKREHLRNAWIAVALALHRASMELAEECGISRAELADHFNARGEAGEFGVVAGIDGHIERMFALVSVLAARRLVEAS